MNTDNEPPSPTQPEAVRQLKQTYMEDEALPEELAKLRAQADVDREAEQTEVTINAGPGTVTSGEDG